MKPVSGKEFCRVLEKNGWTLQRVQGSHHIYAKPGSAVRISVPVHRSRTLKTGLQRFLSKLAGLQ